MTYTLMAKQLIFGKVGSILTVPLLATGVATVFLAHILIVPGFLLLSYGVPQFGGW